MEFRYILEPYKNLSSRHLCPKCGKKELTFYIDTTTGEPIHPTVGKCNRLNNCGYHYTAKQHFIDNNLFVEYSPPQATRTPQAKPKTKPISYINTNIFKASLKNYDNNNFVKFLIKTFGEDVTIDLIKKYYIGSSKHWNNSTVFYQIDNFGKVRAGKIILYDPETGKRVKTPFNHIHWLHSLLKLEDFNLSQCLFGLHLIKDTTKPIAIVESEKTAIIASVYLPQFIWLASGGMQNLRPELFEAIKNRKIILYPDLKCFDVWSEKAKNLGLTNYIVSDLLERKATEAEKLQGLDLADYLLKYDYKALIKEPEPEPQPEIISTNKDFLAVSTHTRAKTTETICNEYLELEKYFNSISLPGYTIELNKGTKIENLSVFVKNHLETVKYQYHNKTYLPYLERLLQVKSILN